MNKQFATLYSWAIIALLAGALYPLTASARDFYDAHGNFVGSSVTKAPAGSSLGTTSDFDAHGNFAGSSKNHGASTWFYDAKGNYIGQSK